MLPVVLSCGVGWGDFCLSVMHVVDGVHLWVLCVFRHAVICKAIGHRS